MATSGSTFVAAASPVRMPAARRLSMVNSTSAVSATQRKTPTCPWFNASQIGAPSKLINHTPATVVAGSSRAHWGARSRTERLQRQAITPSQLAAAAMVHPNSRARSGNGASAAKSSAAKGG